MQCVDNLLFVQLLLSNVKYMSCGLCEFIFMNLLSILLDGDPCDIGTFKF